MTTEESAEPWSVDDFDAVDTGFESRLNIAADSGSAGCTFESTAESIRKDSNFDTDVGVDIAEVDADTVRKPSA